MEIQNLNDHTLPLIVLGSGGAFVLSASVIFFFIRYQKKVQQQREKQLQVELVFKQQLLQANIRSQEEERVRISKELHDHVGGTLSTLRFLIKQLDNNQPGTAEHEALVISYKKIIDEVIDDVRNISHSLAPPGLAIWGLRDSLAAFCEKVSGTTGMPIQLTYENEHEKNILFDHALAIYRIIQELVTNTLKHAFARSAYICITRDGGSIQIAYRDDGIGVNTSVHRIQGIGMQNIESRIAMLGGTFHVDTTPGKGFHFTMEIPAKNIENVV